MSDGFQDNPSARRAVFRLGLKKLFEPLADFLEQRLELPLPIPRTVLRPPGALPERQFLDTCYRCGNCVDACPARAIRSLASGDVDRAGTPYIDPDLCACVVCDELACMRTCPSGALVRTAAEQIRMGHARVQPYLCVRNRGEDCRICVEKCPVSGGALEVGAGGEIEVKPGCVGCGSCQFYCPTLPRAIVVEPA